MRPLYLLVKGFGPYIKVEIPEEIFQLIHQERFFLITGEIGAGKTTLFDAIFFALFGEATFPDRSPKDLISHHLSKYPHIEPEVVFKFLHKGQIYQILRKPPYARRQTYVSVLWINNILYSQNKEEIAEKLKELFGLEGKYFKRVFMLPQGEYRELLLSEPKERKALFEKLFDMEFLSRLENFFKERTKGLAQTLTYLEEKIKEILKLGEVNSIEELNAKINTLSQEKEALSKDFLIFSDKLKSLERELKKVESALDLLNHYTKTKEELYLLEREKLPKIELIKGRLEKLKILSSKVYYYENVKNLGSELKDKLAYKKNLLKTLEKIKETLISKELKWKEIKAKEPLYQEQKEKLPKKKEMLNLISKKSHLTKTLQDLEAVYQKELEKLKNLENEEKEILQAREKLKLIKERIKEKEEIMQKKQELEEKLNYLKAFEEKKQILKTLKEEIEELENKKVNYQREYEAKELERFACRLAKNLKEGIPCPVCGSPHHPKKATLTLFTLSTEKLKEKLNDLEKELEEKKETYSHLQGELSLLKTLIPEDISELFNYLKVLKERLAFLEGEDELKIPLALAEEREKALEERALKLLEDKRELENNLEKLREKRAYLEGELSAFRELTFTQDMNPEELKKEISTLEAELKSYEKEKETIERELTNLEKERSYLEGELKNLEKEILLKVKVYKESFREVSNLVKKGFFKNHQELKSYYHNLSHIDEYEREIQTFESERNRLIKNLEEFQERLSTFNMKGKENELKELKSIYENLIDKKSKIEKKRDETLSRLSRIKEILNNLENLRSRYLQISQEKEKLEGEYPYLEKINHLISGKVSGISFHSFVLSKFLSLILKRANLYLTDFTFGRYRFVEGELFTSKFLLEVFDAYTGKEREVNTLSGGESFLASLAFALGTSDVVIALSKKNPLETLLIDEGFGTLDETTLEKVLQAIFQLSQKTGKIIGVISHLRELKEHFPVLIEIIKQREEGSKIQIKRNL